MTAHPAVVAGALLLHTVAPALDAADAEAARAAEDAAAQEAVTGVPAAAEAAVLAEEALTRRSRGDHAVGGSNR
ncbi:hypothetical protein [Pseudonocardia sp.]|uniref:hypothetical protein n=1 Tax=Pseudonocardia sp. TaxID=60912 RepID=UPI003D153043